MHPFHPFHPFHPSQVGRALLNNQSSRVAFLSGFNEFFDILPTTETHVFVDHVMAKALTVDPFFLFAGTLSANATIRHLTLRELRKEHVAPLAQALRANKTVDTLVLEGSFSSRGVKTELRIELPVQVVAPTDCCGLH